MRQGPDDRLRRDRVSRTLTSAVAAAALVVAVGCSSSETGSSSTAPAGPQSAVKVQRTDAVAKAAQSPAPPASAQSKTAIGGSDASIGTANDDADTDSYWVEEIDIDGDGETDSPEIAWDDEDRILYLATDGPFTCINGQKGDGQMVMAIFADGNSRSKPAGSGWWLSGLDAGECGVKDAGLYGCRFGADGLATECGSITLDETTDDVIVTTIG